MYNCPDCQVKPALSGVRCGEVVCKKGSQKSIQRGGLNGNHVQMLIDTKTMVLIGLTIVVWTTTRYCMFMGI